MLEETFASGTSPLHKLDTRCKLVAAAVHALCTALLTTLPAATGVLLFSCMLLVAAQLPLNALIRRFVLVNFFTLLLWCFLPFTTPGETLHTFGPLTATVQGVALATLITLKTNAIIAAFIALAATSGVSATGAALEALRVPRKLTLLFLFTWRYVHVIAEEYQRLATAARIRGFVPGTNLHTYRTTANLAAMVLVRSWERAERVNNAMRLRGFTGTFHSLHQPQPPGAKTVIITALLTLPAVLSMAYDLFTTFSQ